MPFAFRKLIKYSCHYPQYHKVTGLNKFFDDYQRNACKPNQSMLQKKISKHHAMVKESMEEFRTQMNREIDRFLESLQRYAEYLSGHTRVRQEVSKLTGIRLSPFELQSIENPEELEESLRFILNNSLYDDNLNMINLEELLKQDEEKVFALVDKMVYMTEYCQRNIAEAVSQLKFADHTLKTEKASFNENVARIWKSKPDPLNTANFNDEKIRLAKLISNETELIRDQAQKAESISEFPSTEMGYRFSKYRHEMLTSKNEGSAVVSSISALKPQYALAWPNLNLEPQKSKEWSLKINDCRNFASANTMGVGVAKLSDMKLANYEAEPTNALIVTSQGYTLLNGRREKTDFIFGKGDVLHFKYDPYYALLEIKKQNGRKLTLKAFPEDTEPLYACVRLTYASDEVQFV